jgi:hypothetical protein
MVEMVSHLGVLRMNDLIVLGVCFAIVMSLMVAFFFYNVYKGIYANLADSDIGAVYNFRYFQPLTGDYERYLAKVVGVRTLTQAEISRLNWSSDYRAGDKEFKRSPTLVTCLMGNGDFRQFYAERSDMCRRSHLAGLLFKVGVAHLF